ncbi:SDR family oxidoreductase [Pelotomaculum terephthalicicum JT]|uniref:SDR family oxidoreductase n=1 Tax=Pelotomaculum TaxID=191373 RepID=UPI0009C4D513|nr:MULTISPECIES: SDR family oxidoreductase [Pelotomaculum]MCG9969101.1 SDR family oxidoreductase [Pelotomaculum terephthalicicum JT]OPX86099.1 MAG: UDP-glucose 4-epimerase [Pelotomaculum sp. PtaB.Bin117]OPY60142.1 MAG: UDP-glucose 4-epimerase [Pelotomaculum sp. PtaU1.Bin065]
MGAILVTGGAGFIGSNLTLTLVELGHRVRVLDNFSTGSLDNLQPVLKKIEVHKGDLRSLRDVRQAVAGAEVVFHQGALPSVPRSVADPLTTSEVNISGTLNVFWASRDAGVRRVVYASSSSVYGNSDVLPKLESMPLCPRSPYAATKLAGEIYGRIFYELYHLETVGLRYFNVFGPRQNPKSEYAAVIPRFVSALLSRNPPVIYGDGKQSRDFTFVDDVVQANLLAWQTAGVAGEVFNIAGGNRIALNDLLDALADITGSQVDAVYLKSRPGDVKHSMAGIEKASKMLGYFPKTNINEGLRLTVEWFARENGL